MFCSFCLDTVICNNFDDKRKSYTQHTYKPTLSLSLSLPIRLLFKSLSSDHLDLNEQINLQIMEREDDLIYVLSPITDKPSGDL